MKEVLKRNTKQIKLNTSLDFIHYGHKLGYNEESSGTKKIANIIYSLIASDTKVWIIDDFEHDLHTEIAKELLLYLTKNITDLQFILVTHDLDMLDLEMVHHKALHYFVDRNSKDLSTSVVYLSQFADLRNDSRNSWSSFYRNYRLGQYPKLTINKL